MICTCVLRSKFDLIFKDIDVILFNLFLLFILLLLTQHIFWLDVYCYCCFLVLVEQFLNLSKFSVVGVTQIISLAIYIHQFLFQFYFQLRFAGSPLRYFNIMDLTNHGDSYVASQPTESISAVGVMTGFPDSFCIQGHLARRGPEDKTIDNVESQRRRVARGPVSLAEIRRNPNAMYT